MAIPVTPEVEAALVRLYDETGVERYLDLSRVFIDVRGVGEDLRTREEKVGGYTPIWNHLKDMPASYLQDHLPVREQQEACGHAVRAMYLYSAMADLARLDGDKPLAQTCDSLFGNATKRRMYVTGGIGSCSEGERFTLDYDLPNGSCLLRNLRKRRFDDVRSSYVAVNRRCRLLRCMGACTL